MQYRRAIAPGGTFFFTVVTDRRRPILASAEAVDALREAFRSVRRSRPFEIDAIVVMPDHLHWLLELGDTPLPVLIQALKSRSARAVNASTGRSGPVWQAGYFDRRIRCESDMRAQARYILENPVRRGLVERIEDYQAAWCAWPINSSDL